MQVGEYEILGEIARGAMGVVLRGRDPQGRLVAIKRLQLRARLDAVDLRRFQQEGEATRRLRHPQIVALLDSGADAVGPYQVLELVKGHTLQDAIQRQGRLPPVDTDQIRLQAYGQR